MKHKDSIILASLIFLIILVALIYFMVQEVYKITQTIEEIKKVSLQRHVQMLKVESFGQKSNYQVFKEQIDFIKSTLFENLFIDPEVPIDFVTFVEKEAQNFGLEMKLSPYRFQTTASLKKKKKEAKNLWNFVGYQIKISSINFQNLYRFLKRLENSKWLLEMHYCEIKPKDQNLEATIILKVYAQKN